MSKSVSVRPEWRIVLFFFISAVLASHRTTLDIFIHHHDFFIFFSYIANAKQWLHETGVVPLWNTTMAGGVSMTSNLPLPLSLIRLLAYAGTSAIFATAVVEWLALFLSALFMFSLLRLHGMGRGAAMSAAVLYQYLCATWWAWDCYPSALFAASMFLCEFYEKRRSPVALFANFILVALFANTAIPHGVLIIFGFQSLLSVVRLINGTGKGFALATFGSWIPGLLMAAPALMPAARDAAESYRIYFIREALPLRNMSPLELIWFVTNVGFQFDQMGAPLILAATLGVSAIFLITSKQLRTIYGVFAFSVIAYAWLVCNQELTLYLPVIGKLLNAFDLQRNFLPSFMFAFFSGVFIDALVKREEVPACPGLQRRLFGVLGLFVVIWLIGGNRYREYVLLAGAGLGAFLWINLRGNQELRRKWAPRFFWGLVVFCVFVMVQSHVKNVRRLVTQLHLPVIGAVSDDDVMRVRSALPLGESPERATELIRMLRENTRQELTRAVDIDVLNYSGKSFFATHDIPTLFYADNTSPARSREYFFWMVDDIRTKDPLLYHQFWHTSTFYGASGSPFNTAMLSLAGVKWIFMAKDRPEPRFERVWTGDRLALYRNDRAFPKAFTVSGLEILPSKEALAQRLMTATVEDYRRSVMVRPEDAPDLPPDYFAAAEGGADQGQVRVVKYTPYEVLVEVGATANTLLVLGDTNHPIWKASVDGADVRIYPAYNMFRMVPVPKGRHLVRFYAEDSLFRAGLALSGATLLLMSLWLGFALLLQRRRLSQS